MTAFERRNPKVLDAKRKRRVAAGSGSKVEDLNKLLKMHRQMADMMKQMGRGKGMLGKMMGMGGGPSEAELQKMQSDLAALDPNALSPEMKQMLADAEKNAPVSKPMALPPCLAGNLPGLGGKRLFGLPGLPGVVNQ